MWIQATLLLATLRAAALCGVAVFIGAVRRRIRLVLLAGAAGGAVTGLYVVALLASGMASTPRALRIGGKAYLRAGLPSRVCGGEGSAI